MRLLRPPHVEEGPWVCRRFLISSLTRHHRQRRCGSCGFPTACCLRASCRACCAPLLSGSRHRLEDIAPGAPATMHQKNKCNCWSQCDVRAAASCPALELRQRPLLLVSPARAVQSSDATTATTCCCTALAHRWSKKSEHDAAGSTCIHTEHRKAGTTCSRQIRQH